MAEPVKKQRRLTDLRSVSHRALNKDDGNEVDDVQVHLNEQCGEEVKTESEDSVFAEVSSACELHTGSSSQHKPSCSSSCISSVPYNDIGLAVGKILTFEEKVKFVTPWKPLNDEEYPSSARRDKEAVTKNGLNVVDAYCHVT